ncbi:retrovirus-related pol polyprotein from transposon TNT 1-94 [Tanacetum coccineum]
MIPLIVPSPVATPAAVETEGFLTELGAQVQMLKRLISDHAVRLEELSPALFKRYDRDIRELFTRLRAVKEEIFSRTDLRLKLAEERCARLELAEVVDGGDNKPPMLEKHLYDSWKSRMELYMLNRPHGRMILASVEKGPLVWPSITEDGVTRLKEYVELTPAEAIQADCDIKAINIILQGLPTEIYALVSQHRVAKDLWEKIKLLMQGTSLTKQERECKLYDEFDKFTYKKGERLSCVLLEVGRQTTYAAGTTRKYTPGASGSNTGKQQTVICYNCKGEGHIAKQCTKPKRKRDETWFNDKVLLVQAQASGQALTEEEIAFLADPGLLDIQNLRLSSPTMLLIKPMIWMLMTLIVINSTQPRLLSWRISPGMAQDATQLEVFDESQRNFQKVKYGAHTSLKELKRYLTGFDLVVKERTTATAITGGTWGFEHTKACFRDEIIPFIKDSKDIFHNNFNQYLVEELADVQKVFYQMEQAVEQHRLDVAELKTELSQQNLDFVDKETYDKLCKSFTTLEKHCITLEADSQLNQEIFQQENSVLNQNAPSFTQLFELSELRAQSQAKDTVIVKLKEQIKSLKGNVDDSKVKMDMDEIETLNIELEHRVTKLVAENEHLK